MKTTPEAAWEMLGKPSLLEIEARIQDAQSRLHSAQDALERESALELVEAYLGVWVLLEEKACTDEAKTAISRASSELSELKERLSSSEQVRMTHDGRGVQVLYETVFANGDTAESTTRAEAWAMRKVPDIGPDLISAVGRNERGSTQKFRKAAREFEKHRKRAEVVQSLVSAVSRNLISGSELLVTAGRAALAASVKVARAEAKHRLAAIKHGRVTKVNERGDFIMDGHVVSTFRG